MTDHVDAASTTPEPAPGRFTEWHETFSSWLRATVDREWTAAVTHPFVRDLYTGDVDERVMRTYLVQDYQFVDRFVALLGSAVASADTTGSRMVFARQLGVVAGAENTYFQRAFDTLGVPDAERTHPEQNRTTRAFNELMDSAAASRNYAQCLAVLTVAEWLYWDWATRAPHPRPESFLCREWIELHDTAEFAEWVAWLRAELDRIGPGLAEPDQRTCLDLFARATRLEREFFDAVHE